MRKLAVMLALAILLAFGTVGCSTLARVANPNSALRQ